MFLPMTKEEMHEREWYYLDFILITGDAYVDHPSFGTSIISRVLEDAGYKVGIIAQPNWRKDEDFTKLGKPRYAFLVSSGNIDSMVNHYTVAKKRRKKDIYSPDEKIGLRPDRATTVYGKKLRQIYGNEVPIILGGIEASLRRLAHYDYWKNLVMPSILIDSEADMLIYGMGEKQVLNIANNLSKGKKIHELRTLRGTAYLENSIENIKNMILLESFQSISGDKALFNKSFMTQVQNTDHINAKPLYEFYEKENVFVVQNPPESPLSQQELDKVYSLPYERTYHPFYEKFGGIRAIEEVKWSLISNRGCFGNCNFCALAFHQGRVVTARSHESLIAEARILAADKDFKGYIHDVGGPTANFRFSACEKQKKHGVCSDKQCLFPRACEQLKVSHKDYLSLLTKLRSIENVKKVFVRSGIRFDYLMYDKNDDFFKELIKHHVSGQLKVAPEHVSSRVLRAMGKPDFSIYRNFYKKFYDINTKLQKKQFLVPYFMSSHPGSSLEDAIELAEYLNEIKYQPEQVQDFYPTPGTISTCMYYTKMDPVSTKEIYVADNPNDKAMQRALIQYRNPKNFDLVFQALQKAGRKDLIGFSKNCLIRPRKLSKERRK